MISYNKYNNKCIIDNLMMLIQVKSGTLQRNRWGKPGLLFKFNFVAKNGVCLRIDSCSIFNAPQQLFSSAHCVSFQQQNWYKKGNAILVFVSALYCPLNLDDRQRCCSMWVGRSNLRQKYAKLEKHYNIFSSLFTSEYIAP